MPMRFRTLEEQWQEHVEKTDSCWLWRGSTRGERTKYGRMWVGRPKGNIAVHRYSYERHKGPIPEGMLVRHLCHDSLCVNPDHLEIGTHQDNTQDMIEANRFGRRRGTGNVNNKLREADVLAIYQSEERSVVLAERYGVNRTVIWKIRSGELWTWLTGAS